MPLDNSILVLWRVTLSLRLSSQGTLASVGFRVRAEGPQVSTRGADTERAWSPSSPALQ